MNLMRNPVRFILAVFLFTAISFYACKKENSGVSAADEENASLSASESNAEAEFVFNDVFDNVMGVNNDVGMQGTGVFGRFINTYSSSERPASCFTVAITHLN